MHGVLIVHEIGLILSVIIGMIFMFKKNHNLRKIHFAVALITVVSIFIYLIMDAFSNIGYDIYGVLIALVFASMKWIKKSIFLHVGLVIVSVGWLITIHII